MEMYSARLCLGLDTCGNIMDTNTPLSSHVLIFSPLCSSGPDMKWGAGNGNDRMEMEDWKTSQKGWERREIVVTRGFQKPLFQKTPGSKNPYFKTPGFQTCTWLDFCSPNVFLDGNGNELRPIVSWIGYVLWIQTLLSSLLTLICSLIDHFQMDGYLHLWACIRSMVCLNLRTIFRWMVLPSLDPIYHHHHHHQSINQSINQSIFNIFTTWDY